MQKKKKKKKNWMEATTHKIPKSVAKNLCKKLIQKTSMHQKEKKIITLKY